MVQSRQGTSDGTRESSVTAKIRDLFGLSGNKRELAKRGSRYRRPPFLEHISRSVDDVEAQEISEGCWKIHERSSARDEVPCSPAALRVLSEEALHRQSPARRLLFTTETSALQSCCTKLDRYTQKQSDACRTVFTTVEILEMILQQVDHIQSVATIAASEVASAGSGATTDSRKGSLYACLTVDRIFNQVAMRVISRRIELHNMTQLLAYASVSSSRDNLCRDLVVHRVKTCQQVEFDRIAQFRLRSLELYVCPKLLPTRAMLVSGTLLKVALPGCALVDDSVMSEVARNCPRLEILDLRACELVTDKGILEIARHCPQLTYLNVGRVKHSEGITDLSIVAISQNTRVETLGLAGCAVSDETVLAIARHSGPRIERLSLNQCHRITDHSMCELLRSAPKLQVLEIVGCKDLKDAKTMCYFKVSSGALVETSEVYAIEMQLYEREVRHELDRLKNRIIKSQRRVTA